MGKKRRWHYILGELKWNLNAIKNWPMFKCLVRLFLISEKLLHSKNLYPRSSIIYAKTVSEMKNVHRNIFC